MWTSNIYITFGPGTVHQSSALKISSYSRGHYGSPLSTLQDFYYGTELMSLMSLNNRNYDDSLKHKMLPIMYIYKQHKLSEPYLTY